MTHPVDELKTLGRLQQAYINGQWVTLSSTRSHNIINPSDESLIGELTLGSADDADTAIQAAAAAFPDWSQTSVDERLAILDGVIALFEARAEQLAHILSTEMGAPINYARTAHVPLALAHLQVARDNLASYEFTEMRGTTAIAREPIGVAGLITPWNWPLYQITAKVGPAIASGCTVVLKPSELSPLSALAFADILHDA
ncbi:MAG: aldehyde dehydrogenase family protein, partial [Aestuariibacter sp.]|nr:aldehyde dehydrogenase family protein [Aestuariibacter sp.]